MWRGNHLSRRERSQRDRFTKPAVVDGYREWSTLSSAEVQALAKGFCSGASVLDFGCGAGRVFPALRDVVKAYYGIDRSSEMIRVAKEKHPDGNFHVSDFFDFLNGPNRFDVVLIMHNTIDAIHPRSRRMRLLRLVSRVLNPGGRIVFSSHRVPVRFSSPLQGFAHLVGIICFVKISLTGRGYMPERYHGFTVWQYRISERMVARDLSSVGVSVIASIDDYSKDPWDWTYYVGRLKEDSPLAD